MPKVTIIVSKNKHRYRAAHFVVKPLVSGFFTVRSFLLCFLKKSGFSFLISIRALLLSLLLALIITIFPLILIKPAHSTQSIPAQSLKLQKLNKYQLFLIKRTLKSVREQDWLGAQYYSKKFNDPAFYSFVNWLQNDFKPSHNSIIKTANGLSNSINNNIRNINWPALSLRQKAALFNIIENVEKTKEQTDKLQKPDIAMHSINSIHQLLWQGKVQEANIRLTTKVKAVAKNIVYEQEENEAFMWLFWRIALQQNSDKIPLMQLAIKEALMLRPSEDLNSEASNIRQINLKNGLKFDYVKWLIKNEKFQEAISFLSIDYSNNCSNNYANDSINNLGHKLEYPQLWWQLKKLLIREIIYHRKKELYNEAYKLAKTYYKAGANFADGEWLAGWLALEFLKKPLVAITHFENLNTQATNPLSKSRALYWCARASEELKGFLDIRTIRLYKYAAQYYTTFYGQLASAKLGHTIEHKVKKGFNLTPLSQLAASDSLNIIDSLNNPLVKIAYFMSLIGEDAIALLFLNQFIKDSNIDNNSKKVHNNRARLLPLYLFNTYVALSCARILENAEKRAPTSSLLPYLYPVNYYSSINSSILADHIAFSIIRRESQFHSKALGSVGEIGLMQIMPATGKQVSKALSYEFTPSRLYNIKYNITLGSQHLYDNLNYYNNSLVLAIAAYNGGPSNVNKWLQKLGDIRDLKTPEEKVFWIESIPFYVTREYVMRILETMQIYKILLSDGSSGSYNRKNSKNYKGNNKNNNRRKNSNIIENIENKDSEDNEVAPIASIIEDLK